MMSVLMSPSTINAHMRHYFSNPHVNGNISPLKRPASLIYCSTSKINDNTNENIANDHVPFGVVSSMKQRLLDKANESLFLNSNVPTIRYTLAKSSSRVSPNENLREIKPAILPLKHATRLSRSQDNLLTNSAVPFASYLQPKQDVVIVERTKSDDEVLNTCRHAYSELHIDEVPKPGTVTTVKQMFERQIQLSRYDSDKAPSISVVHSSHTNSLHREVSSPPRSRSNSPNDMALRQRRTVGIHSSTTATSVSLPISTSYPDVVISHTPTVAMQIETPKTINEPTILTENKKNKLPLNIITDETMNKNINQNRPNLLLSTSSTSDTDDYQLLDFKSRLALFNRTNSTNRLNINSQSLTNKNKSSNHINNNNNSTATTRPSLTLSKFLIKPALYHHHLEKNDNLLGSIASQNTGTAKPVTYFGGTRIDENRPIIQPVSIPITSISMINDEQSVKSPSTESSSNLDIISGHVKFSKSSIFSGIKKDARVQFIDNVDTFEYPSYSATMAEYGGSMSDDDDNDDDNDNDEDDYEQVDDILKRQNDKHNMNVNHFSLEYINDVDDDELERLASINAKFNSNAHSEKSLQSKGTLHTFRPSYLDQYELGTQQDSKKNVHSSDMLSREKYFSITNDYFNHSKLKQDNPMIDMTNNIQWSSMSTTTDLLF